MERNSRQDERKNKRETQPSSVAICAQTHRIITVINAPLILTVMATIVNRLIFFRLWMKQVEMAVTRAEEEENEGGDMETTV
ncbi:hypothetical protein QR680_010867 [Steinernema hermaphroditum]|uniref:Uncharacterized protein n=1 Tax=Steinernema hermaphroditum TaxID=289476 RepID=A0AA39IRU9_9BILA|nr:hypothetical protein QR680_010867 [Steinernema hermaphroditum]